MRGWTAAELERIADADTVGVASRRADGTLRRLITIWAVCLGEEVYVRSAYGPENPWYVRAKRSGRGRLRAAGQERDVVFEEVGPELDAAVTAAFHAKYDRYPPKTVATVVSDQAARCTLRLVPA